MFGSVRSHPQWKILKQVYSRRLFRREFLFLLVGAAVANLTLYWYLNSSLFLLPVSEWVIYALFAIDFYLLCLVAVAGNTFSRMRSDGFFNDLYLADVPWNVVLGAFLRAFVILLLLDVFIELPLRFFLTTDTSAGKIVEVLSQLLLTLPALIGIAALIVLLNVSLPADRGAMLVLHLVIIYAVYTVVLLATVLLFNFFEVAWDGFRINAGPLNQMHNLQRKLPQYMAQLSSSLVMGVILGILSWVWWRTAVRQGKRLLAQ